MIEIISIEDPHKPKEATKVEEIPRKVRKSKGSKHIRKFLAEHFDKLKTYTLKLPKPKKNKIFSIKKKGQINVNKPRPKLKRRKIFSIKKKQQSKSDSPNPPPGAGERIWNFLQLISTIAVVFSIAFVAMNWSAYQLILEKRVSDLFGLTDNSQLEKLASDKEVSQDLLPISENFESAKEEIPQLVLDITPPDMRVVIPRINKNVPVLPVSAKNLIRRDWGALEKDIQEGLRSGVVHYPGTALPGEHGNTVLTGHSSYFPWDPGRFKDVFALLHDLRMKDRIVIYYQQRKYVYEVTSIKVVLPEQVEVLDQTGEEKITLLTCTPVGTNLKRLIIEAKPI